MVLVASMVVSVQVRWPLRKAPKGVEVKRFAESLARILERVLWGSRFAVLIAVVGSLVLALGALYLGTADVIYSLGYLASYTDPSSRSAEREVVRAGAVTTIVKAVDEYLIAPILLLFALGLYELFIDRIDAAERSEVAQRALLIRSLDELKGRITSLVLLVLAIEFFRYALQLQYTSALDLLYLAVGILLVSGALYLSTRTSSEKQAD